MHHQHPHVGFELQIGQTYLFLFIFNDSPSHGECIEVNVTRQNDQDQAQKGGQSRSVCYLHVRTSNVRAIPKAFLIAPKVAGVRNGAMR